MSNSVIARRYARALLNIAVAADKVTAVAEGLDDLADTLVSAPAFHDLLANPKIPQVQKEAVMAAVLAKIAPDETVNIFARYLSSKRRAALLDEIRQAFHRLADIETGHAQAMVKVAAALDEDETEQLRRKIEAFSGKTITLDVEVDPALLGGVVTRIGSTVWDGSLRSHLNNIHESIISE